jgi:hypothetical protein
MPAVVLIGVSKTFLELRLLDQGDIEEIKDEKEGRPGGMPR